MILGIDKLNKNSGLEFKFKIMQNLSLKSDCKNKNPNKFLQYIRISINLNSSRRYRIGFKGLEWLFYALVKNSWFNQFILRMGVYSPHKL